MTEDDYWNAPTDADRHALFMQLLTELRAVQQDKGAEIAHLQGEIARLQAALTPIFRRGISEGEFEE